MSVGSSPTRGTIKGKTMSAVVAENKVVSCGVLFLDRAARKVLLGHVTNCPQWDIPKGMSNHNERPLDTAIREVREETGIELASHALIDIGIKQYIPRKKDLHLFVCEVSHNSIDTSKCKCTSTFTNSRGQNLPEMDDFGWFSYKEAFERVAPNMSRLLQDIGLLK